MKFLNRKWVFLVLNVSAYSLVYSLQLNQLQHLSRENSAENLRDLSPSSSVGSFSSLNSLNSSQIFNEALLDSDEMQINQASLQDAQNQTERAPTPRPIEEKLAEKRFIKNLMRYIPTVVVVGAVGYGIHHNRKTKIETLTIQQQTLKAQQEMIAKQEQLQQKTVQTQKNGIITSAVIAIGGILVRIFIG